MIKKTSAVLIILLIPLTINAAVQMEPAVEGNLLDFIEIIVGYALYFTAIFIAPLLYLLASLNLLTAMGETEKINRAKKLFFWTSSGLVLILLAKGLISFLKRIL